MKHIKILILQLMVVLSIISFVPGCASVGAPSSDDITSGALYPTKSYVRVEWTLNEELRGLGSGFVVKQGLGGSYIVTANHVCETSIRLLIESHFVGSRPVLSVRSYDNEVAVGLVLRTDPVNDLCLVYAEGLFKDPVTIADAPPKVGEGILIIGSPQGFSSPADKMVPIIPGIFNGHISLAPIGSPAGSEKTVFQIYTARISPGNSGGMIVNQAGEVIGISNFGWTLRRGYSDLCGGSRLDTIKTFLKEFI